MSKQTNSIRLRVILTAILLIVTLSAIVAYLLAVVVRNAPIDTGRDVTPEAQAVTQASGDTIPMGTAPDEFTFISNRDGSWDIFSMKPDGTITNLTSEAAGTEAHDYFGSWAMDSERINFLSTRSGVMGPTQIEPDGSNPQSLDILTAIVTLFGEGRFDWDPAWSPDGSRIVWSSLRDINLELYTIGTNSEFVIDNALRLTENAGRDWFPAWSPDGKHISFSSDREGNEDVFVVDVQGGKITRLTDDPFDELHAVWSMDGTQILYVWDEADRLLEGVVTLRIMDADGSNQRLLGENETFTGDPTWYKDGAHVLYMSNIEGDWNIYVMDADGNNVRRLTDSDADDMFPVWRP